MNLYAGIDNGISGAIATVHHTTPVVLSVPTQVTDRGTYVDPLRLQCELRKLEQTWGPLRVIVEAAQKFTPGKLALCSVWHSWGTIRAVLELCRIPYVPVDPRTWQKDMFKLLGKDRPADTKVASIMLAKRLFPTVSLRHSTRCTTDNDNFADALLLAEWGRRNQL